MKKRKWSTPQLVVLVKTEGDGVLLGCKLNGPFETGLVGPNHYQACYTFRRDYTRCIGGWERGWNVGCQDDGGPDEDGLYRCYHSCKKLVAS